jgi:hypothetical protein
MHQIIDALEEKSACDKPQSNHRNSQEGMTTPECFECREPHLS